MADFAAEVRRLMTERGTPLRGLAKASNYDPSYLSKVLSGHKPSSRIWPRQCLATTCALRMTGTVTSAPRSLPSRPSGMTGGQPRLGWTLVLRCQSRRFPRA